MAETCGTRAGTDLLGLDPGSGAVTSALLFCRLMFQLDDTFVWFEHHVRKNQSESFSFTPSS